MSVQSPLIAAAACEPIFGKTKTTAATSASTTGTSNPVNSSRENRLRRDSWYPETKYHRLRICSAEPFFPLTSQNILHAVGQKRAP